MAKNNIFDQDIDLQGIAKILNLRLDVLSTAVGTGIDSKTGGAYFNSIDVNLRLNVDETNWYNTLLAPITLTAETFKRLPLVCHKQNYIEAMINSTSDKIVYLKSTGESQLLLSL